MNRAGNAPVLADDVDQARGAVRRLATGVSVLTLRHEYDTHGTTVSSVGAVSRDPLLVSCSLRAGSTFARLLGPHGRFVVNVLSHGQALVADWFAHAGRPGGSRQFDPVDWRPDATSAAPVLSGALAWFSCRLAGRVTAGDHEVLLAHVVDGATGTGWPLLSYEGRLHAAELRGVVRRTAQLSSVWD
jgi:flavin reductase (DIM6/NTAB) family NADH-FMN oxidoreductase RutF